MKKMTALLLAMALLLTPMMTFAQEGAALDRAIADGKTLRTTIELLISEDIADQATAEAMENMRLDMVFATEPAAQVIFSLMQGENTLGDLTIEIGEDDAVYVKSALLGEEAIRVEMQDAELVLDRALAFLVSMGMITAEEADTIRAEIMAAAEQPAPTEKPEKPGKPEKKETQVKLSVVEIMTMDYGPLMDAIAALSEKIVYHTEPHGPAEADPAYEYYGADLTGEDFAKLASGVMTMIYSSKTLTRMMDGVQITSEQIEQALAAVKSLGVGAYFAKDGTLVHLTLLPVIAVEGDEYIGSISYSRRTEGAKTTYLLDLGAALNPAEGEYTVLFNVPVKLTVEENKAALTANVAGYTVKGAIDTVKEHTEDGDYNEVNLTLSLTDAMGETANVRLQAMMNESTAQEEYPTQVYGMMLYLNDEMPAGGVMVTMSAEDPSGTALADGAYVEPAEMTQDEFNAFAEELLNAIGVQMDAQQEAAPAAA